MAIPNRALVFVIGFLLTFLLITFDPDLGTAYAIIFTITLFLIFSDNRITIDLNLSRSHLLRDLLAGLGGYAIFLGIAFLTLSVLQATAQAFGLASIIGLMAEVQPALAGNKLLSFISFGFLVPVIENIFFFGAGLEFLSERLNIPVKLNQIKSHALYVLIGILFMAFHFTAKGIPTSVGQALNTPALLITFIFGYVSCLMVAYAKDNGRRELRPSIFMHVTANVIAISKKLGFF